DHRARSATERRRRRWRRAGSPAFSLGFNQQGRQGIERALGGSGMLSEQLLRAAPQERALFRLRQQAEESRGERIYVRDFDGATVHEDVDHLAKIESVWPHYDGNPVLCRLQDVVATRGHQASTDKGNFGQRVDSGKLADAIEQKNARRDR